MKSKVNGIHDTRGDNGPNWTVKEHARYLVRGSFDKFVDSGT